jgi:hypothetical protein
MKKALETVYTSFQTQLKEQSEAIQKLENELMQRRELALKLQGAIEGFGVLQQESTKPENMPMVQLDDEDEDEDGDEDGLEVAVEEAKSEK